MNDNKKVPSWVLITAIIAAFFYVSLKVVFSGDEGRIKSLVFKALEAADKKDIEAVFSLVCPDYSDVFANSLQDVREHVSRTFNAFDDLIINVEDIKISFPSKDKADVLVAAVVLGKNGKEKKGIFPSKRGNFSLVFERKGGKWCLKSLEKFEPLEFLEGGRT